MKKLFILLIGVFSIPHTTLAHVRYIATEAEQAALSQIDFALLLSPLKEPKYIVMIIATLILVAIVYWFCDHNKYIHRWTEHMAHVGESYKQFIPWITRLSLGIILIGGATNEFLISPVLETPFVWMNILQLIIGFFLMAGFMTGISAIVALILFIYALTQDMYLIGSFDILGLILSLFALDSRRPGVDDIVGIPDYLHIKKLRKYLPTILRMGIGIGMAYLAIVEKILTPELAAMVAETTGLVDVIPVSAMMWAFSAGVIEFVVGIMLFIGFRTRLAAVAALIILSMSFFYFGEDVTSHVTLFGTLSAVFILGVGKLGVDSPHPKIQDSL
ncbi:MAG: DoxX family protein [Candidatus Pacebacteria bacterium]|nr:DoxX family protein [Candidatus Paceibacterota bacterium]